MNNQIATYQKSMPDALANMLKQYPELVKQLYRELFVDEFLENFSEKQAQKNSQQKYLTIKQFCSENKFLTEGGLRSLIFNNKEFNKRVIRRIGRKILIDTEAAEAWISEQC